MSFEPIDAVITWVDGEDPIYADKLASYLASLGRSCCEGSAPTRFNQCGEIRYCLQSIERFAPWIRFIYIVTDAQTPVCLKAWFGTAFFEKIKLIDHLDIFGGFEAHLPTFNSVSIESMLWRIKGLSSRFIYFNDDCFLVRSVTPDDFFRDDCLVLRGEWKVQFEKKWRQRMLPRLGRARSMDSFRIMQERSAQQAGWDKHYFHLPHQPMPCLKKSFEDYVDMHPAFLQQTLRYRIRHAEQCWSLSLMIHLALKQNQAVLDKRLEGVIVNGACHTPHKIEHRLARVGRRKKVAFVCMQSMDGAMRSTQQMMFDWLDQCFLSSIHCIRA